jgi:hypothetical protein
MSTQDGELSDVAPVLLELSKDPAAWREARRQAMREKIFGAGAQGSSGGAQASAPQAQQEQAAVLAQLQALRRRGRDDAVELDAAPAHPAQPGATGAAGTASFLPAELRAKLQRANQAAQQH